MRPEQHLSEFICTTRAADIPDDASAVVKDMVLTVLGTMVAGAGQDGVQELRALLCEQGGVPEATSVVFGDRLPASSAALLNGTMARALDYCDAMAPGLHLGSSVIPAGLAASERRGGSPGAALFAAVAVGAEVGSRLNLTESMYDGFDPTGVAGVLAATATVCRVLELPQEQTTSALGLAFNRCGGSFQSNVDGSLAVRLIQGWAAQSAIDCALLAERGFTGPHHFLSGIYGYSHLFARDQVAAVDFVGELGRRYRLTETMFKKYPSCGLTQGATELALQARQAGIEPDDLHRVEVRLPPYAHRLVGHEFEIGDNPRVNAQFSAQWCVANALVHGSSQLSHFEPPAVTTPATAQLAADVVVTPERDLDARGHSAVDLLITTADGNVHTFGLDVAPGFPGNPLLANQHLQRFHECIAAAPFPMGGSTGATLVESVANLRELDDVTTLLPHLIRY